MKKLIDFLFGPSDIGPFVSPPPIWPEEAKKSRFHKSPKGAYGRK